ncbi:MAG TPA: hypothetical protein VGM56_02135 [Byssovorax sp.]
MMQRLRPGRRARAAALAALVVLVASAPALAEPTAADKAGARAAATQANDAFAAKRYPEALDLFTRAESMMHAPTHVLMIARAQVALGKLVAGRENYLALVHETLAANASPAFRQAQADAQTELAALEPRVPNVDLKVDDLGAKRLVVTMDGVAIPAALVGVAHPVDPGNHVFKARALDLASDEKAVKIDEGARVTITLSMHAAPGEQGAADGATAAGGDVVSAKPKSAALKYAGIATFAVGVVGLGVGGVFLGLGAGKRSDATTAYNACGGAACVQGSPGALQAQKLDSDATTFETVGTIGLIAGGVLAGAGVTMFLLAPRSSAPATGAQITPWFGPGSAGVRGTF